jgi:hypothetical protein
LPNPEPTEETRALIQSKPEPKTAAITSVETSSGNPTSTAAPTSTPLSIDSATTSDQTIDLRSLSTSELVEHLTEKEIATSTIPDVVVQPDNDDPMDINEDSRIDTIPDLVIPPHEMNVNNGSSTQSLEE